MRRQLQKMQFGAARIAGSEGKAQAEDMDGTAPQAAGRTAPLCGAACMVRHGEFSTFILMRCLSLLGDRREQLVRQLLVETLQPGSRRRAALLFCTRLGVV